MFFISSLLLTPPYLFSALCWVYTVRNISFFWWRLHKSESFISRQHTSSKTPGRILLFLSNHFLSIFWCQDPSWLTSAGSIRVPYRPVFPVFCHDTWLIRVLFSVHVEVEGFQQWHTAFSTEKSFTIAHGDSLSHKCFCFVFWLRILCLQTLAFDGTSETRAYSLQKKNGVLRKCEESEMSLIHRLRSKEPRFAWICGHCETNARFKLQLYFLPLLIFNFIVHLWH